MSQSCAGSGIRRPLLVASAVALVLGLLIGCQQPASPDAATNSAALAPTSTLSSADARATWIQMKRDEEAFSPASLKTRAALQTELALTPTEPPQPTPTSGPPTPTFVVELGVVKCPASAEPFSYQSVSCWHGTVENKLVGVISGIPGMRSLEDASQGILFVAEGERWPWLPGSIGNTSDGGQLLGATIYRTPQKVGAMVIAKAEGSRLTFVNADPKYGKFTFVFDVATRQFVSP